MQEARDQLLSRQPILDRRHRIVAYELLLRAPRPDPQGLAARRLIECFATLGAETLLGDALGFVEVNEALLAGDEVLSLPHERVVLEIPRLARVTRAMEARCRELSRRGFRLCLLGFERRDPRQSLLSHARYAKFALRSVKPVHLKQLVRKVNRVNVKVVVDRIAAPSDFEAARAAGCDLFQGRYFARPVAVAGRRIDPDRSVLMDLLTKLGEDCDFDEVSEVFKKNPGLGLKLLRLVNSGQLARASRIQSVPEALVLIGRNQLSRWLTLLLYAGDDQKGMEGALLETAARRGRSLELLHGELKGSDSLAGITAELAFLTGMLSLMDVLFGVPMQEVLGQVNVHPAVGDALLHRKGPLAALLRLEEHMEAAAFDDVDTLLDEIGLDAEVLQRIQHEAHAWVRGTGAQRFGV